MSPIIKPRGEEFALPSKYLLFILTVLCSALILITFNTNLFSGPLNSFAGVFVVPFQKGITSVGTKLKNTTDRLESISKLLDENEKLKKQIDELTAKNTEYEQDQYELTQLRELFELKSEYSEYPMVGATVIGKDPGNWYSTFVIDKGSDDGFEVDMNVVAGCGLVGRIIDVAPHWSKVETIIEDKAAVSGMVLSTQDNLVVEGDIQLYKNGVIRFSYLHDDADKVTPTNKVVTSNISSNYLPGLLIGYIEDVQTDSNNITKSGTIRPYVDFEHLTNVLVITELKKKAN